MIAAERVARRIRHSRTLRNAGPLWRLARPLYRWLLVVGMRRGVERNLNGMNRIRIAPELAHGVTDVYEPDVWPVVMRAVRAGDVVADVGAYIGLYALALAQRVGPSGTVYAFEPNPHAMAVLERNLHLNPALANVRPRRCAVGSRPGMLPFVGNRESESRLVGEEVRGTTLVPVVTLDAEFAAERVDVLKIDVEGFEEHVLRGARGLLTDVGRGPRTIFVEVHPYAWPSVGTTSVSLLALLTECGYEVRGVDGLVMKEIDGYGELVAQRHGV